MPPRYYSVRDTDGFDDVTVHIDRDCIDGPARAAPSRLRARDCPDCMGSDDDTDATPEPTDSIERATTAELIDRGECPWCDNYEGDYVGQHASSAHPERWLAFQEG